MDIEEAVRKGSDALNARTIELKLVNEESHVTNIVGSSACQLEEEEVELLVEFAGNMLGAVDDHGFEHDEPRRTSNSSLPSLGKSGPGHRNIRRYAILELDGIGLWQPTTMTDSFTLP